jgi:prepilin-type N-terminal cleavage/methylation domain-containing protein
LSSQGFTLVELLVAATLTAILGVALTRLLISDSRFVSRQDAMMEARQVSRAAMNTLAELRMTSRGGLLVASKDSVTIRVPFAFGMACQGSGSTQIASLAPADSLLYATSVPNGVASLKSTGLYAFAPATGLAASTDTASCAAADSVRVVPGGRLVEITGITGSPASRPQAGEIVYLFQTVTYKFAPSTEIPGRRALWRKAGSAAYEELVTPFDTAARFAFLTGPNLTPVLTPPADLTTVRGLELRLIGQSQHPASVGEPPQRFELITRFVFSNAK